MQIPLNAELKLAISAAAQRDGMSEEEFVIAAITERIQIPQSEIEIAENAQWLAAGGASGSLHPLKQVCEQWEERSKEEKIPAKVRQSLP
jgi:hypothetical protein